MMSMYIGDKNNIDQIRRSDFIEGAGRSGIQSAAIIKLFDTLADHFEKAIHDAAETLGQDEYENVFAIRDKILENSGLKNL